MCLEVYGGLLSSIVGVCLFFVHGPCAGVGGGLRTRPFVV